MTEKRKPCRDRLTNGRWGIIAFQKRTNDATVAYIDLTINDRCRAIANGLTIYYYLRTYCRTLAKNSSSSRAASQSCN